MAKNAVWHDDYWLLLMQIYLHKPVGVKPVYSRVMVNLSMELHIAPKVLHNRMRQLERLETPRLEHIWNRYKRHPEHLERAVSLLRSMTGFGAADDFYQGVQVAETFERDFRALPEDEQFTPVMLILILDLYFALTPLTMVADTPEVKQLAKLMKISAEKVVEVLDIYQLCDPFLNRNDITLSSLLPACQRVWQRYGSPDNNELHALATDLKAYFSN